MRIWLSCISFLVFFVGFSQMKSYAKKNQLQIGEQNELVYEFPFEGSPDLIQFQVFSEKIPCFRRNESGSENDNLDLEIIGNFKDSIIREKNKKIWRGTYRFTVWDTGYLVIAPVSIIFKDSIFDFQAILLSVSMPKTEKGKDIYDIKEQFVEVETDYKAWIKEYWWLLALIILLGFGTYFFLKARRKTEDSPEIILNLKEKTLLELEKLEQKKLWKQDLLKEHYIELSYIFRKYLSERYQLNLLEKTSYETELLLQKLALNAGIISKSKTILSYSDLVKFAKAFPSESEILKNISQVRELIEATNLEEHV